MGGVKNRRVATSFGDDSDIAFALLLQSDGKIVLGDRSNQAPASSMSATDSIYAPAAMRVGDEDTIVAAGGFGALLAITALRAQCDERRRWDPTQRQRFVGSRRALKVPGGCAHFSIAAAIRPAQGGGARIRKEGRGMRATPRFHRIVPMILAVWGAGSACSSGDDASTFDPLSTCSGVCANGSGGAGSGSGGASAQATGGNSAPSGAGSGGTASSGSGGNSSSNGNSGSGGMANAMGSGGTMGAGVMGPSGGNDSGVMSGSGGHGNMQVDAGPPLPDFTLQVDTPDDGASVSGNVKVSGRAPGFLNVEVWDAMHQNPPLAQVKPNDDGSFELSVNTSGLAAGATTWTVYAWDSAPGENFDHTQNVALALTIGSSSSGNNGTPDPGNAYVPAGYTLVFGDEFTGNELDTQKWNTLGPWGVQFLTDSKQKQAFVPEAVSVHDGIVTFTADHASGASNAKGQPYTSGSITTNGTFTHGYFEARVKLPQGKGFWPAYWVTSSTRWPPEWDIFEIIDNVIYGYPHPLDSGKCQFVEGAAGGDSTYQVDDLYGVYHVYGFKWTATDIYWYVDGTLTEHYAIDSAAGANDTYWLNISFQIGGDWPGDPDGSTPFPAHMDVDYMRVYQQQ